MFYLTLLRRLTIVRYIPEDGQVVNRNVCDIIVCI